MIQKINGHTFNTDDIESYKVNGQRDGHFTVHLYFKGGTDIALHMNAEKLDELKIEMDKVIERH